MRIAVSPMMVAVALGLLGPLALMDEDEPALGQLDPEQAKDDAADPAGSETDRS